MIPASRLIVESLEASDNKVYNRVETSTEFATRVPDTHYPMGTWVLVTVNLVSD